jgi:Uncharacterized protein containing a von Willebrand factor type A (vWA) domain
MLQLHASILEFLTAAMSVQFLARAMLFGCLVSIALTVIRRWRQPAELVPSVSIQKKLPGLSVLNWVPQVLFLLSMISLNCWLARPVIPVANEYRSVETRDIFIAVDKSGSMDSIITDAEGQDTVRKIKAAADAVKFFVSRRKGDRIGLAVFDDKTYMHWPLSDDLSIILRKAALIPAYAGGGTNFESPTGPIQAAVDHFKQYGKAKTKVLIMVSDGEAPIADDRLNDLAEQMRAVGGRVYLLGVGENWTDPAKSDAEMIQSIKKFITSLGGEIFSVADGKQMMQAVERIDELEKSVVTVEITTTYRDVSRYFGFATSLFLFFFIAAIAFTRERG